MSKYTEYYSVENIFTKTVSWQFKTNLINIHSNTSNIFFSPSNYMTCLETVQQCGVKTVIYRHRQVTDH